jgi:hypothetical protein
VNHPEKPQLDMVWPTGRVEGRVGPTTPFGYKIRTYEPGEEAAFLGLMADGGFESWDDEKLEFNRARVISGGWRSARPLMPKALGRPDQRVRSMK